MKSCIFSPNFFAFPIKDSLIDTWPRRRLFIIINSLQQVHRVITEMSPLQEQHAGPIIRVVSSGLMECYSKEQMGVKHVRRLIQLKSLSAAPRRLLEVHVKEQRFRSLTAKTKLMPGIQMARQQIWRKWIGKTNFICTGRSSFKVLNMSL